MRRFLTTNLIVTWWLFNGGCSSSRSDESRLGLQIETDLSAIPGFAVVERPSGACIGAILNAHMVMVGRSCLPKSDIERSVNLLYDNMRLRPQGVLLATELFEELALEEQIGKNLAILRFAEDLNVTFNLSNYFTGLASRSIMPSDSEKAVSVVTVKKDRGKYLLLEEELYGVNADGIKFFQKFDALAMSAPADIGNEYLRNGGMIIINNDQYGRKGVLGIAADQRLFSLGVLLGGHDLSTATNHIGSMDYILFSNTRSPMAQDFYQRIVKTEADNFLNSGVTVGQPKHLNGRFCPVSNNSVDCNLLATVNSLGNELKGIAIAGAGHCSAYQKEFDICDNGTCYHLPTCEALSIRESGLVLTSLHKNVKSKKVYSYVCSSDQLEAEKTNLLQIKTDSTCGVFKPSVEVSYFCSQNGGKWALTSKDYTLDEGEKICQGPYTVPQISEFEQLALTGSGLNLLGQSTYWSSSLTVSQENRLFSSKNLTGFYEAAKRVAATKAKVACFCDDSHLLK